jgi:hypothetical protein
MCCVFILGVPSPKPTNQRFVRSGFPLQSFFVPQKGFPLQSFTQQHFLTANYSTQRCKVSKGAKQEHKAHNETQSALRFFQGHKARLFSRAEIFAQQKFHLRESAFKNSM